MGSRYFRLKCDYRNFIGNEFKKGEILKFDDKVMGKFVFINEEGKRLILHADELSYSLEEVK